MEYCKAESCSNDGSVLYDGYCWAHQKGGQVQTLQTQLLQAQLQSVKKTVSLSDYTPLTQKSIERGKTSSGAEYTRIRFHEEFQTKSGKKRNYDDIIDSADQELKDWTIKQPKIWVLTKYLKEEAESEWVKKKDIVNPNSSLFKYLDILQELEKIKKENKESIATPQETLKNILVHQVKLGLSESELNLVYGDKDYRKILVEANQETLKDKLAENTVKNILNVLATKKAQNYLERLKERNQKITQREITNFLNQLKIISQGWEEIKGNVSSENNPLYLPIIQESEALRSSVLLAIGYCERQQEQIKNSRSQATNSLFELLFEEPPTNPLQLANPTFRGFMDTINKLDSVAEIENFQKEMTKTISEEKQYSQSQFQAQIIHIERGNK